MNTGNTFRLNKIAVVLMSSLQEYDHFAIYLERVHTESSRYQLVAVLRPGRMTYPAALDAARAVENATNQNVQAPSGWQHRALLYHPIYEPPWGVLDDVYDPTGYEEFVTEPQR